MRRTYLLSILIVFLTISLAKAQMMPDLQDLPTGKRPNSWHLFTGFATGLNGPLLGSQIKAFRKMPWGEGKSLLTSDSHWRAGTHATVTPTFIRPAVMLGVSPLLITDLDIHYGPSVNFMQKNFESYDDKYDPQNLGDYDGYFEIYHQAEANLALKMAWGPLALLSLTDLDWLAAEDFYFHWELSTIVKDGFFLRHREFLLYEIEKNWRLFLIYENYKYFETDFLSEVAGTGLVVMVPEYHALMFIMEMGYYLHNPDFKGFKLWSAVTLEWDFPDKN